MWPVIGPDYLRMIREATTRGSLPPGVTDGLIILLHKGGTRSFLNNWRPITLLNSTYKLFAKVLQLHLQPILMQVVSLDQSAFLPLRFILDNIFLTNETIHHAKKTNQPLVFLKVDFSKAYDEVDLGFLFEAMGRIGFPMEFIGMTKILFRDAAACMSVNGQLTSAFHIRQGVRQGCPLAPYLIQLIGEILNQCIKKEASCSRIKGINIPRGVRASNARIVRRWYFVNFTW